MYMGSISCIINKCGAHIRIDEHTHTHVIICAPRRNANYISY